MPAVSKSQQKLFCMALAVRNGELERSKVSKAVLDIVDGDMSDEQIKHFTVLKEGKKSLSIFIQEKLIENEFNEQWEEVGQDDPMYKQVLHKLETIGDFSKMGIMFVAKVNPDGHYIVELHGGLNGKHNEDKWGKYLDDIKDILLSFPHAWLIDLVNDVADDVWNMRIGVENIKNNK